MLFGLSNLAFCAEKKPSIEKKEILEDDALSSFEKWETDKKGVEEEQRGQLRKTWIKMLYTLVGIIAFLAIGAWAIKRFAPGSIKTKGSSKRIQVIERAAISPKAVITIVEIDEKEYAICESQTALAVLGSLSKKIETN